MRWGRRSEGQGWVLERDILRCHVIEREGPPPIVFSVAVKAVYDKTAIRSMVDEGLVGEGIDPVWVRLGPMFWESPRSRFLDKDFSAG